MLLFFNLHKQKQALKNIQENENVIIKEADKRSDVVISDKTYYRTKIQEILRGETNYKVIDKNIDNNIISKITKFYKTLNKTQTRKEEDFLTNYIPKISNFFQTTENSPVQRNKKM